LERHRFNTVVNACEPTSRTRIKTGFAKLTSINRRIYGTKNVHSMLFEPEYKIHIVKGEILPKWNNLVKCN
jgi:hypothetical protein